MGKEIIHVHRTVPRGSRCECAFSLVQLGSPPFPPAGLRFKMMIRVISLVEIDAFHLREA